MTRAILIVLLMAITTPIRAAEYLTPNTPEGNACLRRVAETMISMWEVFRKTGDLAHRIRPLLWREISARATAIS